ncbi:MAG: hypothetical protein ACK55I_29180, partial [bacterium]
VAQQEQTVAEEWARADQHRHDPPHLDHGDDQDCEMSGENHACPQDGRTGDGGLVGGEERLLPRALEAAAGSRPGPVLLRR